MRLHLIFRTSLSCLSLTLAVTGRKLNVTFSRQGKWGSAV